MAKSRKTGSDQADEAKESLETTDTEETSDDAAKSGAEDGAEDVATNDSDAASVEDPALDTEEGTEVDDGRAESDADPTASDTPDDHDDTLDNPDESLPAGTEPEPEPEPEPDTVAETAPDPEPTPPPTAPERVVVEKRGGFIPLAFGGIVAATLGYGAAWYQGQQGDGDEVTALSDRVGAVESGIEGLQGQVATLADGPDLGPLEMRISETDETLGTVTGRLDAVQAEVSGGVAGLTDRIAEIDARLTDLEQRPVLSDDGGAMLAEEAIAAYEREISALREEMRAQADRLTTMTEDAEAQLQAARDDIIAAEQAAAETAAAAQARAALGRIIAAVDAGEPFANAVADLEENADITVPEILRASAEEGVLTTAELQNRFPDAARAALAVARAEGVDGESGGVGGFLRSTFNARSVAPQEGDSPNAILSRVDAAVEQGRITDALAEAETLPEVVRAEMSEWLGAAQSRADALSALETLSQSVNDN